ncbi:hypothetical protein L195_g013251 [Trifolium pratense]|uniref:Uncharacterized protein n=1 Tax=Trifolium pratense TaxID=57577 RepID=A0A2K3PMK8_TRIPR|nr:hypothetical protein L195_g013251 [Trifolium pratense]
MFHQILEDELDALRRMSLLMMTAVARRSKFDIAVVLVWSEKDLVWEAT